MSAFRRIGLLVAAATCAAAAVASPASGADPALTVMTRSLYVGAGIEPLLGATNPATLYEAVQKIWQNVQATDFRDRAKALAAEIERTKPDVIGLQEAMLWRTQKPSGAGPATNVVFDYLQILLDELAARGLRYEAVTVFANSDAEFPDKLDDLDIRVTERNAILVRSGVASANAQSAKFTKLRLADTSFGLIPVTRSWQAVDVSIEGRSVRIVNTHLELDDDVPVQSAQVKEILAALESAPGPSIVLGNLNAVPGSVVHGLFDAARYADAWSSLHGSEPGLTCCYAANLLTDPADTLERRIDLVFAGKGLTPLSAEVVGDEAADRTPGGRWPSDHAGVVARVEIGAIDTVVQGGLGPVAVTVAGSRRTVRATVQAGEQLRVTAVLVKGTVQLARRVLTLAANGTVTLAIPRTTPGGRVTLRLTLADASGNTRTLSRPVRLPAPA